MKFLSPVMIRGHESFYCLKFCQSKSSQNFPSALAFNCRIMSTKHFPYHCSNSESKLTSKFFSSYLLVEAHLTDLERQEKLENFPQTILMNLNSKRRRRRNFFNHTRSERKNQETPKNVTINLFSLELHQPTFN